MKHFVYALALAALVLFGSCSYSCSAGSPASVSSGAWTAANSPYMLQNTTVVAANSTLTVEPDVDVDLNGQILVVNGSIVARGTENQKIFFRNGTIIFDSNTSGSVFQNAVVDATVILILVSGAPIIDYCWIDSRIVVKGGTPTISNCWVSDGIHADAKGGSVTIANNTILSKSGYHDILIMGTHGEIHGNRIFGNNNTVGISVTLRISSATVTDNQVFNCTYGFFTDASGTQNDASEIDVVVHRNVFCYNDIGVDFWGAMDFVNNTVESNNVGLKFGAGRWRFNFYGNNFQNNTQYNIEQLHLADLNAQGNWWGTADENEISQSIYDRNEKPIRGAVFFKPYLSMPNSAAPSVPTVTPPLSMPTPTPTPTAPQQSQSQKTLNPEDTQMAVLAGACVVTVAIFLAVLVCSRRRKLRK